MGYTLGQLRYYSEAAMESKVSDMMMMAMNVRAAFHADSKQFEAHLRILTNE